ncbi:MAG: TetR-like C-terminal domain-containing protein [Candidatus Nanopelagicales bacterium]
MTAAASMADEVGLPNLTLAALARALGVRQPSLYKHIEGLPALRRAISLRAKSELAGELSRAAVGRARGDAVRSLAAAHRSWALRHPGRYEALVRAPDPTDLEDVAASQQVVAVVVDVLAGFGLAGPQAIHATRALRAGLHGFVSLEAAGGFGLPIDVEESFTYLVDGYVRSLTSQGEQA